MTSAPKDVHMQILTVAEGLFMEHGYHGLSMRQIAEAVGVSKAALYYHFKDKEELFLAILNAYLAQLEAMVDQVRVTQKGAGETVRSLVQTILSQPEERRAVMRLFSQEVAQLNPASQEAFRRDYHDKFIGKIQAILQEGVESGELRPLDPGVAAWVLLGMMYPYFIPAHSRQIPPTEGVVEQMVTIFLDGMRAD